MPKLVLYTTGFCAPCRSARQVLDYVGQTIPFELEEINASDHPERAMAEGIRSTPTLISVSDDEELWRIEGVPRLKQLKELLST